MGILEKIRKGKKRSKGEKRLKTIFGKHQMRKRSKVNKLLRRIKGRSTAGEETARKLKKRLREPNVEKFLAEGTGKAELFKKARKIEREEGKVPESYWKEKIEGRDSGTREFTKQAYKEWKKSEKGIERLEKDPEVKEKYREVLEEPIITEKEIEEYKKHPEKREEIKERAMKREREKIDTQGELLAKRDKMMAEKLSKYGYPEEKIEKMVEKGEITEKEAEEYLQGSVGFMGSTHSPGVRRRTREKGTEMEAETIREEKLPTLPLESTTAERKSTTMNPREEYLMRKSVKKSMEKEIKQLKDKKRNAKNKKEKNKIQKKIEQKKKRKNKVLDKEKKKKLTEQPIKEMFERLEKKINN